MHSYAPLKACMPAYTARLYCFTGQLSSGLNSRLQQAGLRQTLPGNGPQPVEQLNAGSSSSSAAHVPYFVSAADQQQPSMQQWQVPLQQQQLPPVGNQPATVGPGSTTADVTGMTGMLGDDTRHAGSNSTLAAASAQQQQQQDPVVLRTLLQQQDDIAKLRKQNKQLRAAVCKLDPSAAFCHGSLQKAKRGSSRSVTPAQLGSTDGWSD